MTITHLPRCFRVCFQSSQTPTVRLQRKHAGTLGQHMLFVWQIVFAAVSFVSLYSGSAGCAVMITIISFKFIEARFVELADIDVQSIALRRNTVNAEAGRLAEMSRMRDASMRSWAAMSCSARGACTKFAWPLLSKIARLLIMPSKDCIGEVFC